MMAEDDGWIPRIRLPLEVVKSLSSWVVLRRNVVVLIRMDWLAKVCPGIHGIRYTAWHRFRRWWCRRQGCRRCLLLESVTQWLLEILLVIPTPLLYQPFNHKIDAPAGLFVDLVNDREDLFLLGPRNKAFTSVMNGTKCYTCNTPDSH